MGCLIVLLSLLSPRLAIVAMWLFTNRLGDAFESTLGPILGFLLVPWTTLMFALLWGSHHSVQGFEWFLVAFAFMMDMGSWVSSAWRGREQF